MIQSFVLHLVHCWALEKWIHFPHKVGKETNSNNLNITKDYPTYHDYHLKKKLKVAALTHDITIPNSGQSRQYIVEAYYIQRSIICRLKYCSLTFHPHYPTNLIKRFIPQSDIDPSAWEKMTHKGKNDHKPIAFKESIKLP